MNKRSSNMTIVVCLGAILIGGIVMCGLLSMHPQWIGPAVSIFAGFMLLIFVIALVENGMKGRLR